MYNPLEHSEVKKGGFHKDIYKGIVKEICDPFFLFRVKVEVHPYFRFVPEVRLPWAMPLFTLGFVQVPPIGAWVWVWFEEGDIYQPWYFNMNQWVEA